MKTKGKYYKLSVLLLKSNKILFLLMMISSVMGFSFLGIASSLSQSIIETKQKSTMDTYGSFISVVSDVDEEKIENIIDECSDYECLPFEITGSTEYNNKVIAMGNIDENAGQSLGIKLVNGTWAKESNEIVIENYLTDVFQVNESKLPCKIKLQVEAKEKEYIITGIINNYSSMLSINCDLKTKTNPYPSIITGGEASNCNSVIIKQKQIKYSTLRDEEFLISEKLDNLGCQYHYSLNDKLYAYAYLDNQDTIFLKNLYFVIIILFLILGNSVIIRYFIIKNRKTIQLFQFLGLSEKQKDILLFVFCGGSILIAILISLLIAMLTGNFLSSQLQGYCSYYFASLQKCFILEFLILLVIFGACILFNKVGFRNVIEKLQFIKKPIINKKATLGFARIDIGIIVVQTVCIGFIVGTFIFSSMFKTEDADISCILNSKQTMSINKVAGYSVIESKNNYFEFDDLSLFDKYAEYMDVQAEAETGCSTLIFDKGKRDNYFSDSFFQEGLGENPSTDEIVIPNEIENYEPIPDRDIVINIISDQAYDNLQKENGIKDSQINDNEQSCVVIIPEYEINEESSIKENENIQLGRVVNNGGSYEFDKHSFRVSKIINDIDPLELEEVEDDDIAGKYVRIIISEKAARESEFVLGYNRFNITIAKDSPKEVKQKIFNIMANILASVQGSAFYSSDYLDDNNKLLESYTTLMSKSMMIFSILIIFVYISLKNYIDWEKNKHKYGVLRALGMSYFSLQSHIFSRYINSIIIAVIISFFCCKNIFSAEDFRLIYIVIAIAVIVVSNLICEVYVYAKGRNKPVTVED